MADASVLMAWAAIGTLAITAIGTFFLAWQVKLTREAVQDTSEATEAMRKANNIMRAAEDARLIFNFPEGAKDPVGGFLLDMVITNIGRSACTIHTLTICGEHILMESVFLAGEQKKLPQFAIVPADRAGNLLLEVDQTFPLKGRFSSKLNYRVLHPTGNRKTWWALQIDNLKDDVGQQS